MVLIENVAEMKNAFKKAYTRQIIEQLNGLGYYVGIEKLLAADYGVPQLRRRTFFFANRIEAPVRIPKPTHLAPGTNLDLFETERSQSYVKVWEAIADLSSLESEAGKSPCDYLQKPETSYQHQMRKNSLLLYDRITRALTAPQLERVLYLEPGKGQGMEALSAYLRPRSGYSGAYARLFSDEPARTITRWVFHPGSHRFYYHF